MAAAGGVPARLGPLPFSLDLSWPFMLARAADRGGRNAINESERKDVVVLRFLRRTDGELQCRITDVQARESWMAPHAYELWSLTLRSSHTMEQE